MAAVETYVPRLKAHYKNVVREELIKELGVKNVMQVPNLEKIVINMGVGRATQQSSLIDGAVADLTAITGQKPIVTKSRTSIASFKLRENQAIGAKVTLRGDRMWEFFDRLISVAIPRIRDFRGLPGKSWDGNGNYTFGLTETDLEGKALLDAFGFPFRKGEMPASTKKSRGATKRSLKK
jgi:large subunit ribosomal protein L5